MDINFLLKGAILGFSIAAPVGPIGILCIRKTMQFGRLSGLASGLGAACADVLYGIIAAFGLTFVSDLLLAGQFWFRLFGGLFLIALGGRIFFFKPVERVEGVAHKTLLGDFLSTFFLTLSNPMTILAFMAVFAGLGLTEEFEEYSNALILILGIFLGSALWWLILSEGVTFFRKKLSHVVMLWINRIAGLVISALGLLALIDVSFAICS